MYSHIGSHQIFKLSLEPSKVTQTPGRECYLLSISLFIR